MPLEQSAFEQKWWSRSGRIVWMEMRQFLNSPETHSSSKAAIKTWKLPFPETAKDAINIFRL
jgi:hypothetical protein